MKKIILFILVSILMMGNIKALKIVSLGDSITYGYLLNDNSESFDDMFASTLGAEYYEFSYLGMRSDDLLKDLDSDELKSKLEEANIIIINIGANDLLDLLDYADLSKVGIEIKYGTIPKISLNDEFLNNLKTYIQDFITNDLEPMAIEASNDFSIIFPSIIEKIREYNSDAKLIINNLYNPFFNISIPLLKIDLTNIENSTDKIINDFNDTINGEDYTIIDVHTILRDNKYLNVNPMKFEFDPHPNLEGHKKIYELYLKELCYKVTYENKDYYVLKGGSIDIKPKRKFGYTFLEWNYDLNKVESDIVLKATYKINYLYIIIPIGIVIVLISLLIIRKKNK